MTYQRDSSEIKENNSHLVGVMKATEGGFEEISLPAYTFKYIYLALPHSIT